MYSFSSNYISSCFQHSSGRINSTAALRGTFILEMMPLEACMGLFYNYRVRKSRESSRISVNSCPVHAAFGMFLNDS